MKTIFFAAGALFLGTTALAGVRFETITRDIKSQAPTGATQVVQVQGGKVRATNDKTGAMILKNATLYLIDDQRKTYSQVDKAAMQRTMNQAGAQMAEMQEQLKSMPPEQRAQMEKMMGPNMQGLGNGRKDIYDSKDTGKTDTVEGRRCRLWSLLKNGKPSEELCVVPFTSLPGKEDLQKTFKELAEAFDGLAKSVPGAGDSSKARNAINGYPVRTRHFDDAGKPRTVEEVLKSWSEESMPASTFDVPAGYRKEAMPTMGG
ncbi:MAG: DUF4412 domain-containing protein [Pseudomonadota bacterium]